MAQEDIRKRWDTLKNGDVYDQLKKFVHSTEPDISLLFNLDLCSKLIHMLYRIFREVNDVEDDHVMYRTFKTATALILLILKSHEVSSSLNELLPVSGSCSHRMTIRHFYITGYIFAESCIVHPFEIKNMNSMQKKDNELHKVFLDAYINVEDILFPPIEQVVSSVERRKATLKEAYETMQCRHCFRHIAESFWEESKAEKYDVPHVHEPSTVASTKSSTEPL
jgi:hypothetical protein